MELTSSLAALGLLAFAVTQNSIEQAETDTAEGFGLNLASYSNVVAEYIADVGTGIHLRR